MARVGLALSDELHITVSPYKVLACTEKLADEIAEIVRQESVGRVVLGVPAVADGKETEVTQRIHQFAQELRELIMCDVVEWDESYTSQRAVQKMVSAGVPKKKRRKKGTTDLWAA